MKVVIYMYNGVDLECYILLIPKLLIEHDLRQSHLNLFYRNPFPNISLLSVFQMNIIQELTTSKFYMDLFSYPSHISSLLQLPLVF